MTEEDFAADLLFEVWPENWTAVQVFRAMQTQWRVGASGPTGFDYSALGEVWRRLKVPPAERDEAFDLLQIMELEALDAFCGNS